jgi:hypothetical protein
MKTLLLPEDLRDRLLAYLMERPFKEVVAGVAQLQALQEAPSYLPPPTLPDEKKKD